MTELKTLQGMAESIGVHPSTLRALAKARLIPHHRIGKKYFFDHDKVMEASSSESINSSKVAKEIASQHNGIALSNGYLQIYVGKNPIANKNGYVPLHHLVMQAIRLKLLGENELVHHKNGNTLDNRFSNLEIKKSLGEHNSQNRSLEEKNEGT